MNSQGMLAVEGLPGAGKTSFVSALRWIVPELTVIPELLLPPPQHPDRGFFVMNDLAKIEAASQQITVALDRTWVSTAAYVCAETRWNGTGVSANDVVGWLYPHRIDFPRICLFIDSPKALALAFSRDGLFSDLRFRVLLRNAYLELFDQYATGQRVFIVPDNSMYRAAPVLRMAFGAGTLPLGRQS